MLNRRQFIVSAAVAAAATTLPVRVAPPLCAGESKPAPAGDRLYELQNITTTGQAKAGQPKMVRTVWQQVDWADVRPECLYLVNSDADDYYFQPAGPWQEIDKWGLVPVAWREKSLHHAITEYRRTWDPTSRSTYFVVNSEFRSKNTSVSLFVVNKYPGTEASCLNPQATG
jgi:hypothetical protein